MYFCQNFKVEKMSAQIILKFDTTEEFARIFQLLKEIGLEQKIKVKQKVSKPTNPTPRQAGWGKGLFAYVAPDFDDTPTGFEDYMLPQNA
jgi:hypothetical protein